MHHIYSHSWGNESAVSKMLRTPSVFIKVLLSDGDSIHRGWLIEFQPIRQRLCTAGPAGRQRAHLCRRPSHSFRSWIWYSELLVPHISIQYIYVYIYYIYICIYIYISLFYTPADIYSSRGKVASEIGFLAATQSCLWTLVLWNDEKSYLQMMKNPFREWICRNYLNDDFPYPGKVYFLDLPNLHMAFFGMPSVMGLSWFWRPLHSDIDYSILQQ